MMRTFRSVTTAAASVILLSGIAALCSPAYGGEKSAPRIWFAPMEQIERPNGALAGSMDYFDLFTPDAPWTTAAKGASVFKIYPELLRNASDEQIRQLVAGVSRRGMALTLESPVLIDSSKCARPAGQTSWIVRLVARLKRLGADLKELAMVGPLVDGHVGNKGVPCTRALADVAAEAAATVALLRQDYPDLVVGEIEPLGEGSAYPDWRELGEWFAAWREASGRPLAFLHMDINWGTAWSSALPDVARQTRGAGIRFGVIYNGEPSDLSDQSFTAAALTHADEVEGLLAGPPDDVILQSWENYPRHALPDTELGSKTGLLRAYLRSTTRFVNGVGARPWRLLANGTPLQGAEIHVEVQDAAPTDALQALEISGVVPHGAVSALFALRIHAECNCPARPAYLSVHSFDFRQADGGLDYHGDLLDWGSKVGDAARLISANRTRVVRMELGAERKLVLNTAPFAVTADQPFKLQFAVQVDPASEHSGLYGLVFLATNGRETQRVLRPLQSTWREVWVSRTDAAGAFDLPPLAHSAGVPLRLRFAGDIESRPAVATVKQ